NIHPENPSPVLVTHNNTSGEETDDSRNSPNALYIPWNAGSFFYVVHISNNSHCNRLYSTCTQALPKLKSNQHEHRRSTTTKNRPNQENYYADHKYWFSTK